MKGRVLIVLMWKHCVVRKRRYLHTPMEFLTPIFIIILMFMFRDKFNPVRDHSHDKYFADVDQPEALSLNEVGKPPVVLYTPNTPKTQELINSVAGKFDKISRRRTTFTPFENDDDIFNYTKEMEYDEAIVIFQNMSGETWPQALNYTIRMKNAFMTGLHQSLDENAVPHSSFGSIYEKFMVLQWAIDTSYLELLTDSKIKQNVTLQEFPYVRRQGSAASSLVCTWMRPLCWLSLLLNFVFLMTRLLEERSSGIQELLKMMGVSSSKLAMSHILNVAAPGILFSVLGAVLLTASSNPLIKESSGFLIFVTLALYYMTIVSFAFAASYLTKSMQYAVSLSVLTYVLLWLPASMLMRRDLGTGLMYLTGLLPHVPMIWIWTEASVLETNGQGLTVSTMFEKHSSKSGSAFAGFILLICQTIFFFFLAWYLDHVKPGMYGQALSWKFLCQRHYWRKNDVTPNSELEQLEELDDYDQRYFQPVPPDLEVGIRVLNVSKAFPKRVALQDVSLDVHRGEITVLLGHNGAGKTTLMSIITGMLSANSGKVFVNGVELGSAREAVRRRIGLCPQHNLFFKDLTVLEHVILFTLFKKGTFKEARESSEKLLGKLGILDKKNSMSGELSGGMKRRLQLACALAGDADVLILDEPTSGLDVETRRELWDLLLALRGSRTVLLSTHFMEEADALGDRVAALHQGRVRCYATPLYLKKAIGTGYRLTFTTKGVPNENAITRVVTSHVADATVKESSLNSISYNLPATASPNFPKLFASLEEKRSELAIVSIGVGVSTLEEVFLRLCSDIDTTFTRDEVDDASTDNAPKFKRVTGFPLYLRQTKVLLRRQLNYVLSKIYWFMILQVILPIIMIILFTISFNTGSDSGQTLRNAQLPLNMDMYRTITDPRALYNVNVSDADLRAVSDRFPHVLMQRASDVADVVLRSGERNVFDYNKYLVGVELNSTDAMVLYTTTTVRHAAPVALNLLTNIIATQLLPWADGRTITTNNYPLEDAYADSQGGATVGAKSTAAAIMWAVTLVFIILATHITAVSLPCKERITGARHIHIMAGAPIALHWGTTLLAHTVPALFALVIPACIVAALLDEEHTLTEPFFIVTLFVMLLLGSLSFFALMYLVSFFFAERGASILLVAIILLFGLVIPGLKSVKDMLNTDDTLRLTDLLLQLSSVVMPPHTLTAAAARAAVTARANALCSLNRRRCPTLLLPEPGFDPALCCATTGNMKSYFSFEKTAPGSMILCLFIQFIVLMTVVWLMERGAFARAFERAANWRYRAPAPAPRAAGHLVRAERAHVAAAIALPTAQITDAMLVSDLHKNYRRCGRSCNAVKGINFSVKKGECFGLLGVNGAGKSTTFKMLTAETCPTKGQVFANGNYLTGHSNEYLRGLGYCPQFFGLDEFQTGMQNLTLLLTLRGRTGEDVKAEAKSWLKVLGLEKYANRAVREYSGGCARRLAAGCALANGAALTLLDEPTAGVDVAARRRVWAALRTALKQGRALIITSHSMDEMEALCHRIAIMSAGEVCALGSPAALRAAHAAGHAVLIKVAPRADETDSSAPNSQSTSQLNQLKSLLHQKFNCTLKDEHKTMLHYHINETMQYSELFRELEALKQAFPLMEDYSVTETTLEEVFLSFARPPAEGPPARPV